MRAPEAEAEESYFVSMTDMLVGLIFIFIILLMYFALSFKETTEVLLGADEVRDQILQELERDLKDQGVQVSLDLDTGVLRLPNEILFNKGDEAPTPEGDRALGILAEALMGVLPCYTFSVDTAKPGACMATEHSIEALFIEGHTDSDKISGGVRIRDNWDLSVARATSTYRSIIAAEPDLETLESGDASSRSAQSILSVAGYSDRRPIAKGDDEQAKSQNRRIDLRLVMRSPRPAEQDNIEDTLDANR